MAKWFQCVKKILNSVHPEMASFVPRRRSRSYQEQAGKILFRLTGLDLECLVDYMFLTESYNN